MVMLVKTMQVNTFKSAIDSVKDILGEVSMEFCPVQGVTMPAVDAGKKAFVCLQMPVTSFEVFDVPKLVLASFEISHLYKAVKNASSQCYNSLEIVVNDDVMSIHIHSTETGASIAYDLKLLKDVRIELSLPRIEYTITFDIDAREMLRYLRDIQAVGSMVKIRVKNRQVVLVATGALGKCKIKIPNYVKPVTQSRRPQIKGARFSPEQEIVARTANVAGRFNVRYLTAFCKGSCLASPMTVKIAHGMPLCCEFKVGGLGTLQFYLCAVTL